MVPLERSGREGRFAPEPRIDLIGILRVIRERGAQLWLGEPVVRPAQPALAAAEPVIRGDDLPDVQSRAGHRRPATARPVREDDPRAAPHAHRFFQELRSEEHTSELQSLAYLVCRLLLEKKKDTRRVVII